MSRRSRIPTTVALSLIVLSAIFGVVRAGELREPLPEVLSSAAPDEMIPVSIVLERQVSRTEVARLAATIGERQARRAAIAERLRSEARRGQAALLALLDQAATAGKARNVRPLWISSVVGAELTADLVRRVAALPDVHHVNHNPKREVFLGPPASLALEDAEIECGVARIRAPEVWSLLGRTGEGAVVAMIDTGVCYTHPDVAGRIWVNPSEDLDHDGVVMDPDDVNGLDDGGNGFVDDLIGWNFDLGTNDPNDANGHGSHTAGTVAGDGTSGTQSGTAPGARLMVLRVGVAFSDEVDVWNAMQYAADNAAHAISMSLGWPHSQNPDRATWRTNSENTIDMGTAMVIAAGNEGFGNEPDNVRTPGDVPRVITVGATDCADAAAGFSSRGPVTWQNVPPFGDHPYPPGLTKPDVAAPGVDTKSHNFCSGYSFLSGTSMATPHVAGLVALIVGANPALTHDQIKQILEDTAVDLGAPGKDNVYGSGRVDAYEAVSFVSNKLVYDGHTTSDADPHYGNGDGNVDLGETVRVTVSLRNQGTTAGTNVWAILTTTEPAVEIVDSVAYFPDVPVGGTGGSLSPHLSFRLGSGCGQLVPFRLEIRHDNGSASFSTFTVPAGAFEQRDLFVDDMETDRGWAPGGPEVVGRFVREDPYQVSIGSAVVQPEDDVTPSPGVRAWVTGNPRPQGPFNPHNGDVDTEALLDSPIVDASSVSSLNIDLTRWFSMDPPTLFESTHYELLASTDGGASWATALESQYSAAAAWTPRSLPVPLTPTSQMRFRVRVVESRPGSAGPSLVECLIDDVRVWGSGYFCDTFTEPPALPPNPVGSTLGLAKTADSLRLEWSAPATDATHDAATSYRIYRSASPASGFAQIHTVTATFRIEAGELTRPESWYYLVASANGGGPSGEAP